MRHVVIVLLLLVSGLVSAQVPFPAPSQPTVFSNETKDWGVAPTASLKLPPYHAQTPLTIPGARVIKTLELKALMESDPKVVIIDVLDGKSRVTIPGAYWMPGGGDGKFYAAEKGRFAAALDKLTEGDKSRPVVFLCISAECWLSYNASLHALEAGHKDVIWYRGGSEAWNGASLDRKKPRDVSW